jgi:hypothetical protein
MRLGFVGVVAGILSVASGCYHDHYHDYRAERYDPSPLRVDDLGDGRHYRDHHVYEDSRGNQRDYHHIHHYDD